MHKEMEKCWLCGKPATRTLTNDKHEQGEGTWFSRDQNEIIEDGTHRAYCEECFKKEREKLSIRKRQYIVLKKQLMFERAIRSLERQNVAIYHYKDLIQDFEAFVEEDPDLFDSSEEMLAMLILADNGIKVKPQFKIGRYRVDFLIPSMKVVLEIDGDRHGARAYEDNNRDILLRSVLGEDWEVVRIGTEFIDANAEKIVDAIKAVKEKKQKLRAENNGVLPEWYSRREKAKKPRKRPPIGDDELLDI